MEIDFALILGGDGTILKFARDYASLELPILGINLGRVGALSRLELDNYEKYLLLVKNNDYIIEKRLTLEGKVYKGKKKINSFFCINEINISKAKPSKMISLNIEVNSYLHSEFYADGLILATSSGSTAYSLASGGPLLLPSTKAYVLTPICPQFNAFTSVVLEENDKVTIKASSSEAVISVDGNEIIEFNDNEILKIKKYNKSLKMIDFKEAKDLYGSIYKVAMSIYKK